MSKSNFFETALLELVLNGEAITGLTGTLYVALHTADPGEAGNQSTSEAAYTGYERVALSRDTNWTVTGNSASPAATIAFPASTSAGDTVTHFSIGLATSGAGEIIYYGALTPTIVITSGTTPQISDTSTITEE